MSENNDDWIWIEPGSFSMGRPDHPDFSNEGEERHTVTLSRGFWVQAHPVTQAQWKSLMKNNPSKHARASEAADLPVENIHWFSAIAYCNALSRRHDLQPYYHLHGAVGKPGSKRNHYMLDRVEIIHGSSGFRLLTEAEWEYVCRAGTDTITYAEGSSADNYEDTKEILNPIAWCSGNSRGKTHPVASKRANAWGVYDMLGNVQEWVWDWYADDTYTSSPAARSYRPRAG